MTRNPAWGRIMAKKRKKPLARGPKGGKKHTPGRDHDGKSRVAKDRRRRAKAEAKRAALEAEARRQWAVWDRFDTFQKKLLHDQRPTLPRPPDAPPS